MKSKKVIIITVVVCLLGIGIYSFLKADDSSQIQAQTLEARKGTVTTMVTATGTIEPITQVAVGTQVSGVVERIYVDFNSEVKEGQLIAELDKTNLKAALTQAQASYDNAINDRDYKQTIFNRQNKLFDNQVISQSDYDDALYALNTAKGTLVQRLSDLQRAKTNLGYADIYSPIDGVVLSRAIDEGQTVAANFSTPTLFTIAQDLKEMQVEADVDEADIGEVKDGQRVTFTVDAYQGHVFDGIVTQVRLDPTVTSNVVTYTVVIRANNPDLKLKPGLTATIAIYTLELKDVLSVEAKAVNFQPNGILLNEYEKQHKLPILNSQELKKDDSGDMTTIWTYEENGSISPKEVKLGASDGVNVQVISGLNEGEKLVYSLKEISTSEAKMDSKTNESPFMPQRPGAKKK